MKKLIFSIIAVSMIYTTAFAGSTRAEFPVKLESKKSDKVKLTFDLGNITKLSKTELESKISEKLQILNNLPDELECSITVKGELNLGPIGSVSVEVTVSGPCSEVRKEGKAIAEQILKEIQDAVTE